MKIKHLLKYFVIVLIFVGLNSCGSREETVSCFPEQYISVAINLTLPEYDKELTNKGWMYIDEQQSGTRGLIVVRMGTYPNYKFKAYDRNAPHICPDTNTTLEVKGGIKIVCPKDGAEWILADGSPVKISNVPPKTYRCNYNPNSRIISIYN